MSERLAEAAGAAVLPLPEDEEDSDSFSSHKRELRLGLRHRDSFAVHASHLTGAALEEAIVAVHAGKNTNSKKKNRLAHQDSMAVLVRKKHEGQLDQLTQPQIAAASVLLGRRVSRDDSVLRDAPTSPEMHAQARGAETAHELGSAAHVGRMGDAVRRSVSAGIESEAAAYAADTARIEAEDDEDESEEDDGDDGSVSAATPNGLGGAELAQAPGSHWQVHMYGARDYGWPILHKIIGPPAQKESPT